MEKIKNIQKISNSSKELAHVITNDYLKLVNKWNSKNKNSIISLFPRLIRRDSSFVSFGNILESTEKTLGTMVDHGFYKEIILSDRLLNEDVSFETLQDVANHELAHFIDSVVYGNNGHGKTFKNICKVLEIESDSAHLKYEINRAAKSESMLEKIKKLLALSESSNMNEAQSALLKAKTLMREYGVERNLDSSEDAIYRVELVSYKQYTQEIKTIANIASEISNTWVLLSYNSKEKVIYAHGTKTECEIASYLFDYLRRELKQLLSKAKKESGESSKSFSTSFYFGVLQGFFDRLEQQRRETDGTSLVEYKNENANKAKRIIYSNQSFGVHSSRSSVNSYSGLYSGKKAGANLKIRNGISNSSNSSGTLYIS